MKLETLKARIGRADYDVDTDAVAEAIVSRLLSARRNVVQGMRGGDGNGSAEPGSALPAA